MSSLGKAIPLLSAVLGGWSLLLQPAIGGQGSSSKQRISFSKDILPILSDKCFLCHGPDPSSRQAGLRLDIAEGAFAERGTGRWAVVPRQPGKSLLIQKINGKDAPMPPPYSGKKLTQAERELLRRWIEEGAAYGRLWSFEPLPTRVKVPTAGARWAKDPLDRFVFGRLQKVGLAPSREAPRWRWLRRATFDLTGLPPTEEEIDAFNTDRRKDAYERAADRMLASPHFGERLAVEWLDAARYSDSYGYQSDLLMPSWPFRDWVVSAFNANKPYDQFLTEQIAGDLLPNATRDEILATAFNRLHRQSNEGGSIAEEFKTEYAVDRVNTFGTAVLGLTVGCARCHDHKFDPLTQKEYYQLYGYFNNIKEYGLLLSTEIVPTPSLLLPTQEQATKLAEARKAVEVAKKRHVLAQWEGAGTGLLQAVKIQSVQVHGVLGRFELDTPGDKYPNLTGGAAAAQPLGQVALVDGHQGKAALLDGDNGVVVRGLPARERWEPFSWSFWVQDPRQKGPVVVLHRTGGTDVGFCGFDLMLEDGFLTARVMRHWPGNAVAVRSEVRVPKGAWAHVGWSWDGSGDASGLKLYLNGRLVATETIVNRLWKKINAYGDLGGSGGDWCFGQRFRDAGFKGGKIDDVVFVGRAVCEPEMSVLAGGDPVEALSGRQLEYAAAIDPGFQSTMAELRKAQEHLANVEEPIREISVMAEANPEIPAYLLARGAYDAPKNEKTRVRRGVPASLPPLGTKGKNDRLALARWATQPNHPLTARVAVNRFWQMLFGVGLVETSENFGTQGAQPSNPELLDYLAREFVDSGWDVKKLLRRIVLSATYRQDSSLLGPEAQRKAKKAKDPQDRFFSRGPSRRLSAEMVRDLALSASGLLTDKLGGPPVNPYQPAGIWQENNTMSPGFVQSKGADLYRRSLYTTWKRTTPAPNMMLFDATSREACTMRRPATNTPLQALVLLNDIQFVEACRVLAERLLKSPGTEVTHLQTAFRRLSGRRADPAEMASLLRLLGEQRALFRTGEQFAEKLLKVGDSKADRDLDPIEVASLTVAVQAILSSDAVIWKR
ncbi:MAG: DUF1553 domain-containing protein [Armatimonadetes bacterium]|nr:DUF1553 domain-containing protein [Armatimonadota bacterium]